MVNIFDVARYILCTIGGEVSTLKLQKLCYYAQAWHLARHEVPLFKEEFEKWNGGPVCRELFNVHKGYFSISERNIPEVLCSNEDFSNDEFGTLELILQSYGTLAGDDLSDIAHSEEPWKNTKKNDIIPKDVMMNFYFAQWGNEGDDLDDDVIVTKEEIEQAIESSKDSPIYETVDAMFQAILGDEAKIKINI
jgi:uncharacterized phage-associated protein